MELSAGIASGAEKMMYEHWNILLALQTNVRVTRKEQRTMTFINP